MTGTQTESPRVLEEGLKVGGGSPDPQLACGPQAPGAAKCKV